MSKITAAEAKELAGPTIVERLDAVYDLIRTAATNRERRVALHDDFWVNGGYSKTPQWKEAVSILENDGFRVSFYYKEMSIAVDMYTLVEW